MTSPKLLISGLPLKMKNGAFQFAYYGVVSSGPLGLNTWNIKVTKIVYKTSSILKINCFIR